MKHIKLFELFEGHLPDGSPKIYYHGTNEEHGKKILSDGFIKPGNETIKRGGKLTPIIGRTYATPSLREAVIYCIGGSYIGGRDFAGSGYVFEIPASNLTDVVPDEDKVGELLWYLYTEEKSAYMTKGEDADFYIRASKLHDYDKSKYKRFAEDVLTATQLMKVKRYDDYADFAVAGKKMNKYMSSDIRDMVISLGAPVAQIGQVKFSKAWRFDKDQNSELKKDCSNFFELAKEVSF